MERLICKVSESDLIDLATTLEESIECRRIARLDARNLLAHEREIGGVTEHVTIVEAHLVKRIERTQGDIVCEALAADSPQILEQIRCGDDRRAGIKGVSVLAIDITSPARPIETLEHRDLVPTHTEANGRSQSTETTTDDDRVTHSFCST